MTNSIQTDKRPRLFPREDNYEVVKYVNETLKSFYPEPLGLFQSNLVQSILR